MIKRIFVISLCVAAIIAALVVPASAANIDYNDLISNVVVDGDNDLVTINVPEEYFLTQVVDGGTGEALITNQGGSASFYCNAEYPYSFIFYAFQNGSDRLLLDNIPNNTTCTFDFYVTAPEGTYENPSLFSDWYFFDSNGQYLSMDRAEHGKTSMSYGDFSVTHILSKAPGAVSGSVNFTFYHLKPIYSGTYTVQLRSLYLTFSISSLYRLQQQTGKTNEILTEVEKQLEANGQKLDQIINGDNGFDSSGSDFGSQSDELAGAGDQMGSAINDGMNSLGAMVDSPAFVSTLTTLSSLVNVVFTGHEIEICGVKGNPFMILVTVFSIAVLLPLGLKFIFRKWGDGDDSGGE